MTLFINASVDGYTYIFCVDIQCCLYVRIFIHGGCLKSMLKMILFFQLVAVYEVLKDDDKRERYNILRLLHYQHLGLKYVIYLYIIWNKRITKI